MTIMCNYCMEKIGDLSKQEIINHIFKHQDERIDKIINNLTQALIRVNEKGDLK